MRRNSLRMAALAAVALVDISRSPVRAEISASGPASAIVVEVRGETVATVLQRLERDYRVRISKPYDLDDPITAVFRGPLETVVHDILKGHNLMTQASPAGLQVSILGRSAAPAVGAIGEAVTQAASPQAAAGIDPTLRRQETPPTLSARGQRTVRLLFGPDAPPLQIDEQFLEAYANRALRGNTRPRPDVRHLP